MTKKILFVNAPSQDPSDRFFGWPTSLLYAIAPSVDAARNGNLDIEIVPKIFDPINYSAESREAVERDLGRIIEKEKVNILCASATYDSVYPTHILFDRAKQMNPKIKTILGGPHFDEVYRLPKFREEVFSSSLVDVAIEGDGEFALKSTLEAMSKDQDLSNLDWHSVLGIAEVYTPDGKVYSTSGQPLNLNDIPFIPIDLADESRHSMDYDVFTDKDGNILNTIQMMAARGCRYSCSYCSENRNLAYPNARSVDNILEEVRLRKSQGFKAIFFDDSTFGTYPRLEELLKGLGEFEIKFGSLNRFNHLGNQRTVEQYASAGYVYAYCSIEQLDDLVLNGIGKAQNEKTIRKSMELIRNNEFKLGTSLLFGLPNESERSITRTLDFTEEFVKNGTIKIVSQSALSYHPGTALGEKVVSEGFVRTPPNQGYPFDRFEEGQWYHPPYVTPKYLEKILKASEQKFGPFLSRNRHSWYAKRGLVK